MKKRFPFLIPTCLGGPDGSPIVCEGVVDREKLGVDRVGMANKERGLKKKIT